MRIDSAGMPLPDREPDPRGAEWHCPGCSTPTWPGVDRDGALAARRCVPCQQTRDREEGLT